MPDPTPFQAPEPQKFDIAETVAPDKRDQLQKDLQAMKAEQAESVAEPNQPDTVQAAPALGFELPESGSPEHQAMVLAEINKDLGRMRGRNPEVDALLDEFEKNKGENKISAQFVSSFSTLVENLKTLETKFEQTNNPGHTFVSDYVGELRKVMLTLSGFKTPEQNS